MVDGSGLEIRNRVFGLFWTRLDCHRHSLEEFDLLFLQQQVSSGQKLPQFFAQGYFVRLLFAVAISLNKTEEEVVFLKATYDLINAMANHEMGPAKV